MPIPTNALDPRVGIPAPKVPVLGSDRADVTRPSWPWRAERERDNHDHHYHNHLSVSLVGRRVSSAYVPADDYRFIDRGGTIFVTVVALGQSE